MHPKYFFSIIGSLVMASLLLCLTGCSKDAEERIIDPPTADTLHIELALIYPPNGIGDRSYCDIIYTITNAIIDKYQYDNSNLSAPCYTLDVQHICPFDMDDAASRIAAWDEKSSLTNTRRLLVLTTDLFESILKGHDRWRSDTLSDVLMMDKRNSGDADLYTLDLPFYGPAWEAGYLTAQAGTSTALMLANQQSQSNIDVREGWLDGYEEAGGNRADIPILEVGSFDDEARTSVMSDSLFRAGFDQVVCVVGGAQIGALRTLYYNRQLYPDLYADKHVTICENIYSDIFDPCVQYVLRKEAYMGLSIFLAYWFAYAVGETDQTPGRETVIKMSNDLDSFNVDVEYEYDFLFVTNSCGIDAIDCCPELRESAIAAETKYLQEKR